MSNSLYYTLALICVIGIIWGIRLMNSPKTAISGNLLGAISLSITVLLTLLKYGILSDYVLWAGMIAGGLIGYYISIKVTMLKIPQMVALFNGLGGGASGLVAIIILAENHNIENLFIKITAVLGLIVGWVTFSGSIVAALKLDQKISQKPIQLKKHNLIIGISSALTCIIAILLIIKSSGSLLFLTLLLLANSSIWGIILTIRVGGADMPITISLLNSLSGVAGAVTGLAIYDPVLVAVGGIVGAAGLILTQVMCKAMNRSLTSILTGKTAVAYGKSDGDKAGAVATKANENDIIRGKAAKQESEEQKIKRIIEEAKSIVIIPGYGMALAQAQYIVKGLYEKLTDEGKEVKFAIHPVAGRMPGHMNVLLAEADIPYDSLFELDDINDEFSCTDLVIVVGANDVINPAANTAEGTPIYGMPILNAHLAKNIIIFNKDTNPGYAGVPNTLYELDKVILKLGDAKDTISEVFGV
jgi:NAD(P) transhydrogenase subunit beta